MGIFDERVWHPTSAHPNPFGGKPSEFLDFCTKAAGACPEFCLAETVPISFGFALKMVCGRYIVAKERVDAHLSEDVSEAVVKKHLPSEWVMRKLHPDYGVDVSIEVFERVSTKIPTMGEFLFVQLKSTSNLLESVLKIRERGNVEKAIDAEQGQYFFELDIIKYTVDSDTIDNARLMGPSTPLMLFVVDIKNEEVYYICLTDYYDKILEPRGFDFKKQNSVTINIPKSNRLSDPHSPEAMRFFATRAKLYAMFNLAQFQFRESRYLLDAFSSHEHIDEMADNYKIIDRFARRLRAMPIWGRPTIWQLMRDYRERLDRIISEIESGALEKITDGIRRFLVGDDEGLHELMKFTRLCTLSWEQFSAIGQTFEDLVREWFLPTLQGR
jgi:hypothetical protein